MRRKLFTAAFLLLGATALHAQESISLVAPTPTLSARMYPSSTTSAYYMLDLRDIEPNLKNGGDEKFKIGTVPMNEFHDKKWSKTSTTQELLLVDKEGNLTKVMLLLPANLTPLPFATTRMYADRVFPAMEYRESLQMGVMPRIYNDAGVPAIPAVPATPGIPATKKQ